MTMESSDFFNNNLNNLDWQGIKSELNDVNFSSSSGETSSDYKIFDLISHLVCVTDTDASIKYANRCWLETTGFKDIQASDIKIFDVIHSQELKEIHHLWQESTRQLQPFEVELPIHLADGNYGLGGSIKIESQLGEGAKFIFTWSK